MQEKKQSSNWYIVATHYLTAGFVPFFLGGIVFSFLTYFLINLGITNTYLLLLFQTLFLLIIIYFGVRYAAGYINKTYIIKDANRVVNLATTYYIIFNVIGPGILYKKLISVIIYVILAVSFYVFSKKYIKISEPTS